jgi:hypothetical protein
VTRGTSAGAPYAADCLAYPLAGNMREDQRQTRRDIRAAIIFGVVAATIEMAALLYFLR